MPGRKYKRCLGCNELGHNIKTCTNVSLDIVFDKLVDVPLDDDGPGDRNGRQWCTTAYVRSFYFRSGSGTSGSVIVPSEAVDGHVDAPVLTESVELMDE